MTRFQGGKGSLADNFPEPLAGVHLSERGGRNQSMVWVQVVAFVPVVAPVPVGEEELVPVEVVRAAVLEVELGESVVEKEAGQEKRL